MSGTESASAVARACADAMWASDLASRYLGIEIVEIDVGFAKLAMKVEPHMANGQGIAHGGFIFTLADSTFAFACNTYNVRAVAAQCNITYLRPGKLGTRLIAEAREVARAGRSGLYDVTITDDEGPIAAFRGYSRTVGGALVASDQPAEAGA